MSSDHFVISRVGSRARAADPIAPPSLQNDAPSSTLHPLFILAISSSARLDDPGLEGERVALVEAAIVAGREGAHALARWLSQSLAEYRGSHSAWDLEATSADLRTKLERYEQTLREIAGRLVELIPGLSEKLRELELGGPSRSAVPGRSSIHSRPRPVYFSAAR